MKTKSNHRKNWREKLESPKQKQEPNSKSLLLRNLLQTNFRLLKNLDISNAVLF